MTRAKSKPPLSDEDEMPMRKCNACSGAEPGWRDVVCPWCGDGVMQVDEDTIPAPAPAKKRGRK